MKNYWKEFSLIFVTLFLCIYCETGTPPGEYNEIIPDTGVQYDLHLKPMFVNRCGGFKSSCHAADGQQFISFSDRILFLSHITFRNGLLVDQDLHLGTKQKAEFSPLYRWVTDGSILGFAPAHPGEFLEWNPLSENQTNGIRQWLIEGAETGKVE